jgi:UDP-glucose 6-dehydrogenase
MKPTVVIGVKSSNCADAGLYAPFVRTGKPIMWTSAGNEKMHERHVATKISFINEMAVICAGSAPLSTLRRG